MFLRLSRFFLARILLVVAEAWRFAVACLGMAVCDVRQCGSEASKILEALCHHCGQYSSCPQQPVCPMSLKHLDSKAVRKAHFKKWVKSLL